MFNPSLTTVNLNHEQLGIQAVNICRLQGILSENASITVRIPCEIRVAGSTANAPVKLTENNTLQHNAANNIFKDDKKLFEIQALEKSFECVTVRILR